MQSASNLSQSLRENLALVIAHQFRGALEDIHARPEPRNCGLTNPVIAFVNRRAARYCYERLKTLNLDEVLAVRDWQPWIDGMWSFAVSETNLNSRVVVAKTIWGKVCRSAERDLRYFTGMLAQGIKAGTSAEDIAKLIAPPDWDSPSIEVPSTFPEVSLTSTES